MSRVLVAGVGMTSFYKPGEDPGYCAMGAAAAQAALADADLSYDAVEQAVVSWVYGDSTSGQAALYEVGLTGIPIVNVNNNCSSGSTALFLARQAVLAGEAECVLALGFEQMRAGALGMMFDDRQSPVSRFMEAIEARHPEASTAPMAARLFGAAGYEYQQLYGAADEVFAAVRVKASRHAARNEKALFRKTLSIEEVLASPKLFLNLTRLQACPPTCGAAAAIVCSERFARRRGLRAPVVILGQAMTSDTQGTFDSDSMINLVGGHLARAAADAVYEKTGIGPQEVGCVELHDCFAPAEVIACEALRLCPEGGAASFVSSGDNTYGGRVVVNPSGGLLSKGHPLGATGLAQCVELTEQLRGQAGARQVDGVRIALQHNMGTGSACVVTMYGQA